MNDSSVSSDPEPINLSSVTNDIKDEIAVDGNDSGNLHMINNYQVGEQAMIPRNGILDRTLPICYCTFYIKISSDVLQTC